MPGFDIVNFPCFNSEVVNSTRERETFSTSNEVCLQNNLRRKKTKCLMFKGAV